MLELNDKFSDNFEHWSVLESNQLDKMLIYLQCIAAVGEILVNKTNSKHFLYFDLCKRILSDSISDESFRKKFFENPSNINSLEISDY